MIQVRDPHTGELVHKAVFIVFLSGQRSLAKVTQICDSFGANRYIYPAQFSARIALLTEVQSRVDDLQHVLAHVARHRAERLSALARQLPRWRDVALKQKAVYRVLNMWNYVRIPPAEPHRVLLLPKSDPIPLPADTCLMCSR